MDNEIVPNTIAQKKDIGFNIDTAKVMMMFLIVIALGLFVVNQTLGYIYKAQFLKAPCKLCAELNENVTACMVHQGAVYWNEETGWEVGSNPLKNITINYSGLI